MKLEIDCKTCGGQHFVPLDASGRYEGPHPCQQHSGERVTVRINPQQWRDVCERVRAETAR